MSDLNEVKTQILGRLEIRAEMEAMGIMFEGSISANGWLKCRNPYKPEQHASCGVNVGPGPARGYLMVFNMSNGAGPISFSFFDVAKDFIPEIGGDFGRSLKYFAEKTGVVLNPNSSPPSEETVQHFIDELTDDIVSYFHTIRGFTDETITQYKLGWSTKRKRISYPVYDENEKVVNIRFHNSEKKPKTLNTTGYGEARLFNVNQLVNAPEGSTVSIHEGEFDAMLTGQHTGLVATSPTNGCSAFLPAWVEYFHGHNVVILFDCDHEGRNAVQNILIPAFKPAVISGAIPSLKIVWMFAGDEDKDNKDATDWFVKYNGSGGILMDMIDTAEPEVFGEVSNALPPPVMLDSFLDIENSANVSQRVSVPLFVYGENSETYHSPTQIIVPHCPEIKKGNCTGRSSWNQECTVPIEIPLGSRIQLASVGASDAQLRTSLCDYICDRNKRPSLIIDEKKKITLRELFAHQILKNDMPNEANELIEKPVYVIGGGLVPIGQYQATGFVRTHPKNQKPTMLIDTLERQDQDWQGFKLENAREDLETLQELDPMDIVTDLCRNITRIYKRPDLHLGVLLTLVSPLYINLPGDDQIRGWISSVVIGDSASGKTTVSDSIFKHANVGYRVSGMTSSRTGITYAIDRDERRGWRIKAGALLKMSRQALIIDEAQDLPEEDLKTMSDSIDSGEIRIAKVQTRTFEAMTRCFFSCNPKMMDRQANQRTMDSFRFGCMSLLDIFPAMMLRRLDLAMFAAQFDIEDSNSLYETLSTKKIDHVVTRSRLQHLIHYAWNLKPEQIKITKTIAKLIRRSAFEMSEKFGQCVDLPLVCPQDFRKTLCRIVTAFAILDLSSDDNFETIEVQSKHVNFIKEMFLDQIYSAENCRLHQYSKQYADRNCLTNKQKVALYATFVDYLKSNSTDARKRILYMFKEVANLVPGGFDKASQKEFAEHLQSVARTVRRDMAFFVNNRLIESLRGYRPYVKGVALFNYILDQDAKMENLKDRIYKDN